RARVSRPTFSEAAARALAESSAAWKFALLRTLVGLATSVGISSMDPTIISGWCVPELTSPSKDSTVAFANGRIRTGGSIFGGPHRKRELLHHVTGDNYRVGQGRSRLRRAFFSAHHRTAP